MLELKAAYQQLPVEIALVDPATRHVLWFNDRAAKTLGYNLDVQSKLNLAEITTGVSADELVANAIATKQDRPTHCALKSKTGVEHEVEAQLSLVELPETSVMVFFAKDLTETIELRSALITAQMYLESAPDPTVVVDESGAILTSNARVESLLGYKESELVGHKVERLIPKRYHSGHIDHRQRFTNAPVIRGMGTDLSLYALTKDGREVPIEVSLSPIVTDGKTLVAAALRDMTARKEADAALRKSEESLREARDDAEAATVSKSRFLTAASHDLRQPLQALRLYLSVLKRRVEAVKDQEVIGKMESSVDTMSELLDALLDISRLNSGAIVPSRTDFSSLSLLQNIVTSNLEQANEKGLTIKCTSSDFNIESDAGLLARIVDNFITNAIRYTPSGVIALDAEHTDDGVVLSVSDTGIGIEQDQLEQVFEEYFQLDNKVRDRKKGLGLGLSIVKHIAALLGHKVSATSVIGEGSVFSVTVPLAADNSQTSSEAPIKEVEQTTRKKTVRLLFVDDDEAIVDATSMLLESVEIEVIVAYSGDEAIEILKRKEPLDMLITDYRLPGFNGAEVIDHARKIYGTGLPAVLMSGDTTISELSEDSLKNCELLRKPVDTDALIELINTLTR